MKPKERARARELRRDAGLPINAIAKDVGVSKSTVSRWVRDIDLTAEQHAALRLLNPIYNNQLRGQDGRRRSALAARQAAQTHGREIARSGDTLHAQGCMLYWAEGTKSRNVVAFVNSDADMMELFLRFLRECYGVVRDRVALTVNCHVPGGGDAAEITRWWLRRLDLPGSSARAPTVNHASAASRRRRGHVLPYGTARISVYSTFIVQSIYGAIQEYAGVERPEWIDLR